MAKQRILSMLGYDSSLIAGLPSEDAGALRAVGVAWLLSCVVLGAGAAHAAWLVQPSVWFALAVGLLITVLTVNLLRVLHAGGGVKLGKDAAASRRACARYRPSLTPALTFAFLAALLSQPAQLPLWSGDLDAAVEEHRAELLAQHELAAQDLGRDAAHIREELSDAGFILFRLKLMWQQPRRAARWTGLFLLIVLLPAFWSRFLALGSVRAYQERRCAQRHAFASQLQSSGEAAVAGALSPWTRGRLGA